MQSEDIRILVVDDNPASRYATSRVLRAGGWTVLEAATGQEALSLADPTIDLVILDVNLPDISGFEVCRQLRADEESKRLPVIHLSATFVKDVDRIQGLEMGADGYLVHPVEPPVLMATVRAFLRARSAEKERELLLIRERTARSEAERANRIKDEFLANLSHELRTPLQAIIGWSQLLKTGRLSAEDFAEGLAAIERNAQAQSKLIGDLLDVSRIASGKFHMHIELIQIGKIIEEVLSGISPAAEAKQIQITREIENDDGEINGDASRLQQVIWNLLSNAIKFTPNEGRVHVTMRRSDSNIEIIVADSGPGIEPDQLASIFERFQQADMSTAREHGGLGLGLAIAKQIVTMHGGNIWAESLGAGHGARFIFTLPASGASMPLESQSLAPQTSLQNHSYRLDDLRILLVEDDVDSRNLLMRVLSQTGAIIREAHNAKEALDQLRDYQPDILISDLGMPGQDGFDLIREVRARGYSSDRLPAIALTAFVRPEDSRKALLAGFQIHVAKPVAPQHLIAAIHKLIPEVNAQHTDSTNASR